MNPDPSNMNSGLAHTRTADPAHDAIDLQQWQLEIDNFIDETSIELNELARILEGGPISDFSESPKTQNENLTAPKPTRPVKSRIDEKPTKTKAPASSDSTDRFASLRKKLASRIEQNKEAE